MTECFTNLMSLLHDYCLFLQAAFDLSGGAAGEGFDGTLGVDGLDATTRRHTTQKLLCDVLMSLGPSHAEEALDCFAHLIALVPSSGGGSSSSGSASGAGVDDVEQQQQQQQQQQPAAPRAWTSTRCFAVLLNNAAVLAGTFIFYDII